MHLNFHTNTPDKAFHYGQLTIVTEHQWRADQDRDDMPPMPLASVGCARPPLAIRGHVECHAPGVPCSAIRSGPLEALVFVMMRQRGELTDSMRGSVRPGPHSCEAVYTLNGELYRAQWFDAEALARADLATHHDALAAAGWTPVPFQS